MQRWKEEFVGNSHRKCVHVHNNGEFEHGKVLYLEPDWSYLDFLNAASARLNMAPVAKRAFNADGVEIDDCMMIEDDDILFLSNHDDFIAPADLYVPDENVSKSDDKIPHSIGGYKVGELLGRGGFGEVRVGEHHLTGEKVALKFLRKSEIHSFSAAERTNTEIQCLTALKHSNIIRLIHHTETQNHVVLIFELMEGGDLMKFLVRRRQASPGQKACLNEDEARHVFYQVLSAVSYAHNQHICHRDLKLENILLKDSSLSLVKIADFGLSDFYRPGATMKSNCGTLSFLAPEVFKGTANAGPPLDVWAMGVILFALLCGRLPFEGADLVGTKRPRDAVIKARIMKCQYKVDDNLSPEGKDLVRRLLQSDPSERMTIPEIFNHIWIRMAPTNQLLTESHFGNRDNSSNVNVNFPGNITTGIAMGSGNSSGVPSTNDMVKTVLMNTSAMNSLDLLIPISPAPVKHSRRINSFTKTNSDESNGSSSSVVNANQDKNRRTPVMTSSPSTSSKHLTTVPEREGSPGRMKFSNSRGGSRSNSNDQLLALSFGNNHQQLPHSINFPDENGFETPRSSVPDDMLVTGGDIQPPPSIEAKSTIKLIPLRRGGSLNSDKKKSDDEDDDFSELQGISLQDAAEKLPMRSGKDDGSIGLPSSSISLSYRPSTVSGFSRRGKDIFNDDDLSVSSTNSTGHRYQSAHQSRKDNNSSALTSNSNNASPRPGDHQKDHSRRGIVSSGADGKHQAKVDSKEVGGQHRSYVPSNSSNGFESPPPHGLPRSRNSVNSTFSPTTGVRVRHL